MSANNGNGRVSKDHRYSRNGSEKIVRLPEPPNERPLYNELAEKTVLAALLVDNEQIPEVRRDLRPDSFFRAHHQTIYRAILKIHDAGNPVDLVVLADTLGIDPASETPGKGGITWQDLQEIVDQGAGLTANTAHHAGMVAAAAMYRRALVAADDLAAKLRRPDSPPVAELFGEFIEEAKKIVQEERSTIGRRWTVPAEEVVEETTTWLWRRHIPLGNLTMFAGEGGHGKTTAAAAIAANVSRGAPFWTTPDDIPEGPRHVLYVSAEDSNGADLKPKFRVAGANMEFVHFATVDLVSVLTLNDTRPLEEALQEINGEVALMVIDPPTAFLNGDNNSTSDVRQATKALKRFAEEHQLALILVNHFNKGSGQTAKSKLLGSQVWRNACRAVWIFAPESDQDQGSDTYDEDWRPVDTSATFLMANDKVSGAQTPPSLRYRLKADGPEAPVAWEFLGTATTTADDLVRNQEPMRRRDDHDIDAAVEWLREKLSDGPKPSKPEDGPQLWQEGNDACSINRPYRWWLDTILKQHLRGRAAITKGIARGSWYWCAKDQDPPVFTAQPET